MSELGLPKNLREAVPYIVWGVLVLGFGLEFCAAFVREEWLRAGACFILMCVLAAMALYSKDVKAWLAATNPNYVAPAFMLLLLAIILSPFIEKHRWPFFFSSGVSTDEELPFQRELADARKTISDLKNAPSKSLPSDMEKIADLTGTVASLKAQIEAKKSEESTLTPQDQISMPRRLLSSIGDVFGQARVKQSELSEIARQKAKNDQSEHQNEITSPVFYSVPQCRVIVSSTADNQNFAKVIEAIAESQGCQAQVNPPPPPLSHPIDADAPPTVLPDPNSYVVVRYPHPEGVKNLPEPPGEISLHEGISQEINDKAAEFKDKMADNLATALHSCRLDARRSYKAEGVQGWPVDKWTIYVDLGKVQMCQ